MAEPALEIAALEYRYPGAGAIALAGIDLRIEAGEFVVLAGRSGSGKSTLLRAACGLVPHFHGGEVAGSVAVGGRSTRTTGPAELATSVGFVAQEPETQVVSTTVRAELELPLELRGAGAVETARAVEETRSGARDRAAARSHDRLAVRRRAAAGRARRRARYRGRRCCSSTSRPHSSTRSPATS